MPQADTPPGRVARAIEDVAASVQRFPPEWRWLHAQESLILARATGEPARIGPRTRIAEAVLGAAEKAGIAKALIACSNVLLLLWLYLAQFRTRLTGAPRRMVFVGLHAMREPELIGHVRAELGHEPMVVDETDLRTFYAVRRLGLRDLFAELRRVRRDATPALEPAREGDGVGGRAAALALMLNGHRIAYFRTWFRKHAEVAGGLPVAFAAASAVAGAAVAVGIRAIYLPHGFIARAVAFPDFAEAWCFNNPEAEHLARRLPGVRVRLLATPTGAVTPRRIAAIAGVYGDTVDYDLCRPFIEWARNRNVPVIVRTHPRDTSGYWDQWRKVPGVTIMGAGGPFHDFLRAERPMFMATWHSTTLLDALVHGVVPITLSENDSFADNLVFPFRDVALRWPHERGAVEDLLDDPRARAAMLRERRVALLGDDPPEAEAAPLRRTA